MTTFKLEDAYEWILYLNPEVHKNEMQLVKSGRLDTFMLILDMTKKPSSIECPKWLDELPALVNTKTRLAYRGTHCIQTLVSIELPPELAKRLQKSSMKKVRQAT